MGENVEKLILLSNNGTIIAPYREGLCKHLEQMTSSKESLYRFGQMMDVYKEETGFLLEDKEGNKSFVTHYQSNQHLLCNKELVDNYKLQYIPQIQPIEFKTQWELTDEITLTPIQNTIVNEVMDNLEEYQEFFIHLQTGYGKTLTSTHLMSLLGYRTMIFCFSADILNQWISALHEKTDFDTNRIFFISTSKVLEDIYENGFSGDYDILLCTHSLITTYCKKNGYDKLQAIMNNMGVGLKIFDEAHRTKKSMILINAFTHTKYTLYLSADYSQRNEEMEILFKRIFSKTLIIKPTEDQQLTMKYTNAVIVEYSSYPTLLDTKRIKGPRGFSRLNYMEYQFRKRMIFDIVKFIVNTIDKKQSGYKVLVLLNIINHVDRMTDELKNVFQEKFKIGKYHSKMTKEERIETLNDCDLIVSTYQSFGTGIDVSNIKYVISLNQANRIEDNQAAGRARPMKDGSDAIYFMVVDMGFKYCVNKLKDRVEYLTENKLKAVFRVKYKRTEPIWINLG